MDKMKHAVVTACRMLKGRSYESSGQFLDGLVAETGYPRGSLRNYQYMAVQSNIYHTQPMVELSEETLRLMEEKDDWDKIVGKRTVNFCKSYYRERRRSNKKRGHHGEVLAVITQDSDGTFTSARRRVNLLLDAVGRKRRYAN